MEEPRIESYLPQVNDEDFAAIWLEDIIDPTHLARWHRFAYTNPKLMREILARADHLAHTVNSRFEIDKGAIDIVTFALDALEKARRREMTASKDRRRL